MKIWIKKRYWILRLIILAVITIAVSLLPYTSSIREKTKSILEFLEPLSVIIVGILGLIWAYPFLKKKATESYASKMADIIFEANKNVRSYCSELLEKYPIKGRSTELTTEYINEVLNDVHKLYSISKESNYDAYRYANLLFKSIKFFSEKINKGLPKDAHNSYYKEDFSTLVHLHINQILQYASTITSIAQMSVEGRKTLVKNIDKNVIGNNVVVFPGIDGRLIYKKADALLVLFFDNLSSLPEGTHLLRECFFKSAPTVSPFARLLENNKLYAPLQLQCKDSFIFEKLIINLVGYKLKVSQKIESGEIEHYAILYYSNVSQIGFVPAYISKETLPTLDDIYVGRNVLRLEDIIDFWAEGERFAIKISRESLERYYKIIRRRLKKTMKRELR